MKIETDLKKGHLGIFWNNDGKLFGAQIKIRMTTFPRDFYKFLAASIRTMKKKGLDIHYEIMQDSSSFPEEKTFYHGIKFWTGKADEHKGY